MNLSALVHGQRRLVTPEKRWPARQLLDAIRRGGDDLGLIRAALSRVIARAAPLPVRAIQRTLEWARGR